jgi:hypothetical protein
MSMMAKHSDSIAKRNSATRRKNTDIFGSREMNDGVRDDSCNVGGLVVIPAVRARAVRVKSSANQFKKRVESPELASI